jgi:prevent-host-death family protein
MRYISISSALIRFQLIPLGGVISVLTSVPWRLFDYEISLTSLAKLAKIIYMSTISIHDAKTNLSKYIAAAKKGEKIYIGGFGKPEVVLVALTPQESQKLNKRSFAIAKGKVMATDEAFSQETEQAVSSLLLGE